MTQTVTIESLITLLTPVCSGLVCIVLLSLPSSVWNRLKETGMRQTLFAYYGLMAFNWAMMILITFHSASFVYLRGIVGLTMFLVPIILYHFIFILTRTDSRERMSIVHYIIPATFFMIYFVWSLCIPTDVFQHTQYYEEVAIPGYRSYYILISLIVPLRLLFGMVYSILSIFRYRRYRRFIANYSSNLQLSSLYWLRLFIVLWVCFLVVPLFAVAVPVKALLKPLQLIVPVVLIFFQHILLCFNSLRGNYILVHDGHKNPEEKCNDKHCNQITPNRFEKYLKEDKPFLNPDLSIIDMAGSLILNRTYLSGFINETYGMNFSQLINEYRLRELNLIIADPEFAGQTMQEKVASAGFGSYSSYRRALKMREE